MRNPESGGNTMEALGLIFCVAISFVIGLIPVKWVGNLKKDMYEQNKKYLHWDDVKKM